MPRTDVCRKVTAACFLTALLSTAPAVAESSLEESRKAALEECAERQIAIERTRERPSADRVLEACASEAQAFESLLPADIARGARKHLKHLIQHRLE